MPSIDLEHRQLCVFKKWRHLKFYVKIKKKKPQKPYGYFKHMHHLPHTYAGFTGLCAKKLQASNIKNHGKHKFLDF